MELSYKERIENPSHQERTRYIFHRTDLLFQRSNYFVVGMTFLVAALAAILSIKHPALGLRQENVAWLILFLCAFGYFLSFFFMVINHRESIIIAQLQESIDEESPVPLFQWPDKAQEKALKESYGPFRDILHVLLSPPEKVSQSAPHTYMIPLGFCIFWFILLFIIVPTSRQVFNLFGWVWIGYVVVISLVMHLLVYRRRPKLICPLTRMCRSWKK